MSAKSLLATSLPMDEFSWYHGIMETGAGEICIPNISTAERGKRLMGGLVMFGLGLVVLTILLAARISPWWRVGLFPLFGGAASGFFQWRDKT